MEKRRKGSCGACRTRQNTGDGDHATINVSYFFHFVEEPRLTVRRKRWLNNSELSVIQYTTQHAVSTDTYRTVALQYHMYTVQYDDTVVLRYDTV